MEWELLGDVLKEVGHRGAAVPLRPRWNGHSRTDSGGRVPPARAAAVPLRPRWNGHDSNYGFKITGMKSRSAAET